MGTKYQVELEVDIQSYLKYANHVKQNPLRRNLFDNFYSQYSSVCIIIADLKDNREGKNFKSRTDKKGSHKTRRKSQQVRLNFTSITVKPCMRFNKLIFQVQNRKDMVEEQLKNDRIEKVHFKTRVNMLMKQLSISGAVLM